jgi:hypothetical protein
VRAYWAGVLLHVAPGHRAWNIAFWSAPKDFVAHRFNDSPRGDESDLNSCGIENHVLVYT